MELHTATIFRIESDIDSWGIFRFENSKGEQRHYLPINRIDSLQSHCDMKTPWEDEVDIELFGKEWFCAYKSLEDLHKWVSKEALQTILQNNFSILKLKVEQVQLGGEQALFCKENIVHKEKINYLFK